MTIKVDSGTKDELGEALKQLLELKQKQKDNEKSEIQNLIKMLENINSQISSHGMINIKADKVKEMLNEIFTDKLINSLAESKELALKRNLFYTLEKTLVKLDAFYSNSFFKRIKPIGNNDGELAVSIEKNISGVEFKAKNVLNNVGTGVGKANQAMVNNLPSQLVGIIYLIIIIFIIGLIASIFD
jgi:ribosomal protein L17